MRYLGNFAAGQTVYFLFATNDGGGAAAAPTTAGTVSIYKDDGQLELAVDITYTPSFAGIAGINLVNVPTTDPLSYAPGHDYTIVLRDAVIDGETVNAVLATFSIENRHPAPQTNADALLDRTDAIETGKTLRQALRVMAAILAGRVSGAGSGAETFTGLDGTTNRAVVFTDANANRTDVLYYP
ncbi:MAG: hypothetical protein ABFC96_07740 [Thermoguttaceae bacterium]